MTETFVPLVAALAARPAAFSSLNPKLPAAAGNAPAAAPQNHPADKCGKPTVTFQKNGDVISVIRVQCGCGQVMELNCVY